MKNMREKMYKSLLFISTFLVFCFPVSALTAHTEQNHQISFLIDSVKQFKIEQVSSKEFVQVDSNTLNFGLINRAVWLKITIPENSATQLMELNIGKIKAVQIYSLSKDNSFDHGF